MINEKEELTEKPVITDCKSEIILTHLELFEEGKLKLPGKDGIEALARFIYRTYHFKKENGKGYYTLASIKSDIYKLSKRKAPKKEKKNV